MMLLFRDENTNAGLGLGWRTAHWISAAVFCCATVSAAGAQDASPAGQAFAAHCFSPYLTAERAADAFAPLTARYDFYDLRPFSSAAPSPVTGRAATPGTDRRCEVAFDGTASEQAAQWIKQGLAREGLANRTTTVPADFAALPGTTFIAAAQLNPRRIAIVQVGTRPGPNGTETYMSVERLDPLEVAE